jgi:hypothetical protein
MPKGVYKHKVNQGFQKGYKPTEEHRRKLSERCKGEKLSEAHKKKISKSLKGRMPMNFGKGEKNPAWKGGITVLQKLERKAGRKKPEQCEICGAMGKICFDHNHRTGKFRGWICHRCNVVLGFVKENTELLDSIIEYLKKNN